LSPALTIRARRTIDRNLLPVVENPDSWCASQGCIVSTNSADQMDSRRATLTPGTTLRFGSLDFLYTGLVEPIAGRTFGRPPRPNVLRWPRDAIPSSEASRTTSSSACWGQTQHRSVLGSPPTTSPTSPSRPAETDRWACGSSWSGTPQCTPVDSPASWTTR
jgi:hypothetical protein